MGGLVGHALGICKPDAAADFSNMTRVKIKCKDPEKLENKTKMLEILCSKQINVTKVFKASDGYVFLLLNEEQVDKIFNIEVKGKLDADGLLSPAIKVKKRASSSQE